ncbi:HAD hydrolase-like protein [Bifidobacterium gallicum]|uniref:Haloacid dehalogenase n=1 Tax=Bifidobacterium gallicum DSM 20093 = LMG 11596 TaxID=561180 RepID=D1NSK6_9BIFI|nr:HAD hydrolase-like protein [Bifidobacterium gallicum]EFA23658.1 haloacid dehalogenase-like hydrolase [Bifidobacterium gallicum DSM 20093 = LMG 11596]KFI58717.1 haloacid dehalogenase [Bifidobacterium gallicum DSM 20093 = LMG 11596]
MAQHPKKVVLLDLDGTLTKSDPGIIGCVVKAFEAVGCPVPDDAELHRFIGPAIIESMKRNHIPDDKLDEAVRVYRHYYSEEPAFDDPNNPGHLVPGNLYNTVYEGIPEQLAKLRDEGYVLAIATCKPEYQAKPIAEHFHLDQMVDAVYGASRDTSRIDKDQVIRYAFESMGFDPQAGDRALMVGDRWTDVDGAKACGIDCLGCGWGYAEPGELKQHGAYRVIDTTSELADAVNDYFA